MSMLFLHISRDKEKLWRSILEDLYLYHQNRQFFKAPGKTRGSPGSVRNNTLSLQQQIRCPRACCETAVNHPSKRHMSSCNWFQQNSCANHPPSTSGCELLSLAKFKSGRQKERDSGEHHSRGFVCWFVFVFCSFVLFGGVISLFVVCISEEVQKTLSSAGSLDMPLTCL